MYIEDFETGKKYKHIDWLDTEYIYVTQSGEYYDESGEQFYLLRWMIIDDGFMEI